jgi:hypothetical protein
MRSCAGNRLQATGYSQKAASAAWCRSDRRTCITCERTFLLWLSPAACRL